MSKIVFVVGFAAGYVLGARAGRERYEAIARSAQRLRGSQTVQSAAGVLRAQAGSVAGSARDHLPRRIREMGWMQHEHAGDGHRAAP